MERVVPVSIQGEDRGMRAAPRSASSDQARFEVYSGMMEAEHRHKLAAYGSLTTTFAVIAASSWAFARRRHREHPLSSAAPDAPSAHFGDLALLGVATHKVTRIVAKDRVTQPVRAPFTNAEDGHREPRSGPLRGSLGELLTCPYCLAPWVSMAMLAAYAFDPRKARAAASLFAVVSVSDFLNRAYAKIEG